MHETGLAAEIVNIVEKIMKEHKGRRLKTVHVQVGELVAVVPESLRLAYQALSANTALEASSLDIQIIPISAHCRTCRKKFDVQSFQFACPSCHSTELEIVSGNELCVSSLEVE